MTGEEVTTPRDPPWVQINREGKEQAELRFAYPTEVAKLATLARAFLPQQLRTQLDDLDAVFAAIDCLAECLYYMLGIDDPLTELAAYAVYIDPAESILAWRETLALPPHIHAALIDAATMDLPLEE